MASAHRFTALVALTAASLVAPLTGTALASSGPGAHHPAGAAVRAADAGTRLWVARYNIPRHPQDTASAVAVSPDGSTVFVTGTQDGTRWATVAYDAATGQRLWVARYQGPVKGPNYANALAVSPDGSTVFVAGTSTGLSDYYDAATVAYNAATGAMLWSARQMSDGTGDNNADSLAVSPDGSSVYVTGETSVDRASEATTVAYGAASGNTLWTTTYDVPGSAFGGVAVSPDGSTVYAAGSSQGGPGSVDLTAAYDAATGSAQWVHTYYSAAGGDNEAGAVAVSPDGSTVYVTGYGGTESNDTQDYQTIAYSSAGSRLWVRRYQGTSGGNDIATHLAISPDGSTVYVTGSIHAFDVSGVAYGTVAYSSAGTLLWTAQSGGSTLGASGLALSPDGSLVYVTATSYVGAGEKSVYTTVAYDAANGTQQWLRLYYGTGQTNEAGPVAVSPDGSRIFVTGFAQIPTSRPKLYYGYATVAYEGG